MKNTRNISLIEGRFNADEAKEVLLALYNHKIQFHEAKNFSSEIRFGKSDPVAKKRLPVLKQNVRDIIDIIEEAEHENLDLEINAVINVSLKQKKNQAQKMAVLNG